VSMIEGHTFTGHATVVKPTVHIKSLEAVEEAAPTG
jgi:hypothetical protein